MRRPTRRTRREDEHYTDNRHPEEPRACAASRRIAAGARGDPSRRGEDAAPQDDGRYLAIDPELFAMTTSKLPEPATNFARRHIGPSPRDIDAMLESVGAKSLAALMSETLPLSIRQQAPLDLGE